MHFAFLPVLGFTTIKNYTTLKRLMAAAIAFGGFTTIKSYTTFKLCSVRNCSAPSFTTIKNYTQLSNYYCGVPREIEVLLPLRITQLSNVRVLLTQT